MYIYIVAKGIVSSSILKNYDDINRISIDSETSNSSSSMSNTPSSNSITKNISASKLISIDDSSNNNLSNDNKFRSSELFIQDIIINELQPEYKKLSLKKEYEVNLYDFNSDLFA